MSDQPQPSESDSTAELPAEAARTDSPVYTTQGLANELRQGEIISNVAQYIYDPISGRASEVYIPYVVVVSPDCDILRDYEASAKGGTGGLNGLLLYEAEVATTARSNPQMNGSIWKRIVQNNDERFQYLEAAPATLDLVHKGVPALIVDFRRCFTMQPSELYRQCNIGHGARRRCRLDAPYREHFQHRAASYFQRVGLPVPHQKPGE